METIQGYVRMIWAFNGSIFGGWDCRLEALICRLYVFRLVRMRSGILGVEGLHGT